MEMPISELDLSTEVDILQYTMQNSRGSPFDSTTVLESYMRLSSEEQAVFNQRLRFLTEGARNEPHYADQPSYLPTSVGLKGSPAESRRGPAWNEYEESNQFSYKKPSSMQMDSQMGGTPRFLQGSGTGGTVTKDHKRQYEEKPFEKYQCYSKNSQHSCQHFQIERQFQGFPQEHLSMREDIKDMKKDIKDIKIKLEKQEKLLERLCRPTNTISNAAEIAPYGLGINRTESLFRAGDLSEAVVRLEAPLKRLQKAVDTTRQIVEEDWRVNQLRQSVHQRNYGEMRDHQDKEAEQTSLQKEQSQREQQISQSPKQPDALEIKKEKIVIKLGQKRLEREREHAPKEEEKELLRKERIEQEEKSRDKHASRQQANKSKTATLNQNIAKSSTQPKRVEISLDLGPGNLKLK